MNSFKIGKEIKRIRKLKGLSQIELAKDICTQAQISKIEANQLTPSVNILYKISNKLGMDMNYFLEAGKMARLDYVQEVKDAINMLKRERNYIEIKEILQKEKHLFMNSVDDQKFMFWHQAICLHYIDGKSEEAIEHLKNTLTLSSNYYTEIDIEILNSLAIIQKDLHQYENAEKTFKEALKYLKYIPQLKNQSIKIRLLYSLSKVLTDTKRYEESMKYCKNGIDLCIKLESMYLFGELHYHYGLNCFRIGNILAAERYMDKAEYIFTLQRKDHLAELVTNKKEKLLKDSTG